MQKTLVTAIGEILGNFGLSGEVTLRNSREGLLFQEFSLKKMLRNTVFFRGIPDFLENLLGNVMEYLDFLGNSGTYTDLGKTWWESGEDL